MKFADWRLAACNAKPTEMGRKRTWPRTSRDRQTRTRSLSAWPMNANERLEKAIAHLPEREQQVLMLYYQQELTMREVGELMGVGESQSVADPHSGGRTFAVCDLELVVISLYLSEISAGELFVPAQFFCGKRESGRRCA